MSWDNKVVWSEGMFLRTHHFQQFDRYVEKLVRARVAELKPYPWGVAELRINQDLLATGRFALTACRGVLEDGTPFAIPEDADHPPPLTIPDTARNAVISLAVPVRQPGSPVIDHSAGGDGSARFVTTEFEATDANAFSASVAPLQVAKLRMRYLLEGEDQSGYIGLGIARIVEVRSDSMIVLDDRYIPPMLTCDASPALTGFATEILGLLHHRGEALAGRVSASGTQGVAEVADFLLLQLVNRYEPRLAHLATVANLHPERFYETAVELAGELATFTGKGKRPPAFPQYRHDDLEHCFQAVMLELRHSLSAVLEQTAIPIPLEERRYGIRVAPLADRTLLDHAAFILAVRADAPAEALRRHFPSQVKIGPVEQIRNLVNAALPGIVIRALPVAPRQLPYHPGVIYFEMDRSSRYWEELKSSGGMAVHVAGEFPNIQIECWAIKASQG
ncbi:type VI secretion system baseplate subunit TssK [Inquilinus sp. NPDC058860]|uniref:type VI secretion system baseplate subunit TssK n=1 Tax=Inquilinus sp. NPDC058860 TaxID=3346652 RepID=UPI0036D15A0F